MDWWRALIQSQSFFLISAIVCCQSQHVIQKYASNMHTKITFPCTSEPIALWTESVCLINGVTAQCAGGFWEGCQSAVSPITHLCTVSSMFTLTGLLWSLETSVTGRFFAWLLTIPMQVCEYAQAENPTCFSWSILTHEFWSFKSFFSEFSISPS